MIKIFTKFMAKFRICVKYLVEKSPLTLCIAEFFLLKFSCFLPHDNDFYSFLELTKLTGKKNGLFLDVGASEGRSILSFNKLIKGWNIVSIEANPLCVPKLKKIQSKIPNVKLIIKAVDKIRNKKLAIYTPTYFSYKIYGGTSANLKFSKRNMESMFGKRVSNRIRYIKTTAKTIRIDDLNLSPDIIKIDIEGWELNALKGCENTIKRCSPYFLVENTQYNIKEVCNFLEKRGYSPFGFDIKNMRFVKFSEDKFRNCFFIPRNAETIRVLPDLVLDTFQ